MLDKIYFCGQATAINQTVGKDSNVSSITSWGWDRKILGESAQELGEESRIPSKFKTSFKKPL